MVQQGVSPVLHGPGSKLSMQARQECTSTKGMQMRTYGHIIKGHKTKISASTPVNTIHCYLCTACRRQQSFGRKVLNQTQARLMSILACSPVSTDQPSLSALPATITKGIKSNRGVLRRSLHRTTVFPRLPPCPAICNLPCTPPQPCCLHRLTVDLLCCNSC